MQNHIFALALLAPSAALAEAEPLPDFLSSIEGTEVTAEGYIGELLGSDYFRASDGPGFPVDYALDRETLSSLEGCEIGLIEDGNCPATVQAEVRLESNSLRLFVYEVELKQ